MSDEEKAEFLSNVSYFWHEKGEMERYVDFSMEKLREAAPELATAYELHKQTEELFNSIISKYL